MEGIINLRRCHVVLADQVDRLVPESKKNKHSKRKGKLDRAVMKHVEFGCVIVVLWYGCLFVVCQKLSGVCTDHCCGCCDVVL